MKELIEKLTKLNMTISTMESCTGGCLANSITDIEGASNAFKYGAVTYSNDFKIKMGVDEELINKYSVYSMEVAKNMSYSISNFTNSDYGVGITGKINKEDINNKFGSDDTIYASIYSKKQDCYYPIILKAVYATRIENKKMVIDSIVNKMMEII